MNGLYMYKEKMDSTFPHFTFIGVLVVSMTYTLVAGTCSRYTAHIKDTSLQGYVISGHVLKTITGVNFGECFRHCSQTCHCRSFNLGLYNNGVCELNDADKDEAPGALRVKKSFIHVSFKALTAEVNFKKEIEILLIN